MASYKIEFKRSVAKDLRSIPRSDVRRIPKRIDALADDPRPHGAEKLTSSEFYRIRQGAYRIVYEIRDDILPVVVSLSGR